MKKLLILITLLLVTFIHAEKLDKAKLVLLIGQSNMAGRGEVTPADKEINPRIFMLNAEKKWVPATDPLHFDKPGIAGSGLGSEFARQLAAQFPKDQIGLIPCAFGGTSISQWQPNGKLYKNAVERAKLAQKNGELVAILWHQGEADFNEKGMQKYPEEFTTMITQLRKDLSAEKVPLLIGELGYYIAQSKSPKLLAQFNGTLAQLATDNPPASIVSAKDLKHKGDNTHFNRESLIEFGKRYAIAFKKTF